jgi:hypothetical protein
LRFPEGRLSDKNSLPDRQAVLGRVKRRYVDVQNGRVILLPSWRV